MGRIVKVFLTLLAMLMFFLVGMLIGRRTSGQSIRRDVVATIGEHAVYRGELNQKLKLFERRALELLCYEYLIENEAEKRRLRPKSAANIATLSGMEGKLQDLLLQLAVQGLSEDYFHRIHDAFSHELATYDFEPAFFISQSALAAFQHELPGDFAALRLKHGTKVPGEHVWSGLTLRDLAAKFGPEAKQKIENLKDGGVSGAIPVHGGFLVLRVTRIADSYEELRPKIVLLVGSSRQNLVLDSLLSRNQVVSQILMGRLHRAPEPLEKIEAPVDSLPAPGRTPGQGVATPAKFDPTIPLASPGIPKPISTGAAPVHLPEPTPVEASEKEPK